MGLSVRAGLRAEPGVDAVGGGAGDTRLSQREVQIIQLVSKELADRQVATQLRISPRTVDGHLRRIFAKVGAPSRAALAAWLFGQAQPEATQLKRG